MPNLFYRGDSRAPREIKDAGGFSNWKAPLTVDQARSLILRSSSTTSELDLPDKSDFKKLLKAGNKYGVGDYAQWIKYVTAKSHTSSYVSTDPEPSCGGYEDEGYVYEISYPDLYLGKSATGPFSAPVGDTPFKVTVQPKVVIDTQDLATATVIGICCVGEVAFFTPIAYASISRYKPSRGNLDFIDMPT